MLSIEDLQKDIGELLEYLHLTPERSWDYKYISRLMQKTKERYDANQKYYQSPTHTDAYVELVYSIANQMDLITVLTNRYKAIGLLEPRQEYQTVLKR